jgi:DNA-binding NarL/FixJ family response regulator
VSIRVALCDDVADLRELFREVLEDAGIDVVGEAEHGAECIELVAREKPDVLLLDLEMPVMDGLEAMPQIVARSPGTAIIVLSGFSAGAMARKALELGAHSYLEKGAQLASILDAVREAAAAAKRRSRVYRPGNVNETTAPGSASSIHSTPP